MTKITSFKLEVCEIIVSIFKCFKEKAPCLKYKLQINEDNCWLQRVLLDNFLPT